MSDAVKTPVTHIMAYVERSVIDRWKAATGGASSRASRKPEFPYMYASKQKRLLNLAREGLKQGKVVLWQVGALRFGSYLLPPAVLARLHVVEAFDRESPEGQEKSVPAYFSEKWRYVVKAQKCDSDYFSLNNAYSKLMALEFDSKQAPRIPDPCDHCRKLVARGRALYAGLPAHLQTVRKLTPASGAQLDRFVDAVQKRQVVFVSYARHGRPRLAMEIAHRFLDRGFACWIDHWMMPRDVASSESRVEDAILRDALSDGIRQSACFVALVTPGYRERRPQARAEDAMPWTEVESELALALRDLKCKQGQPFWIAEVVLGGTPSGKADQLIHSRDPATIVQQIATALAG